jgi:GntR family transcriptional regulator/MocR family aminotransferase
VDLHVSLEGRRDLAGQIYGQVRDAILDGRLRLGQALPPSRELASRLAVSRNTVGVAYDRLAAEGYISGRVGAGTFVSARLHREPEPAEGHRSAPRPHARWDAVPDPVGLPATVAEFDFRAGVPDARLFPFQTWRRLMADELRASAVHTAAYADPAGHQRLRAAIARHVGVARAVRAADCDVLITNGTQQGLDLAARVLVGPGDPVAVEDPGYPPAVMVFRSHGARVHGVPVDAHGLVVDAIPDGVRAVYVSPSHQFPLGVAMSLDRRMALLAWARERDAVILEDDYDSEFRFAGRPIEPLHSLDRDGRVLYFGSFSKVMLPTLRLGFCIAPPSLYPALRKAKFVADWHTALPAQAALARFVDDGTLARHVRRMRSVYQARHDLISALLTTELGDWFEPVPSPAGLHLSALHRSAPSLSAPSLSASGWEDTDAIALRARANGVEVVPLARFAVDGPPRSGLVFGYGMVPVERIPEGLARLRACLTGR